MIFVLIGYSPAVLELNELWCWPCEHEVVSVRVIPDILLLWSQNMLTKSDIQTEDGHAMMKF